MIKLLIIINSLLTGQLAAADLPVCKPLATLMEVIKKHDLKFETMKEGEVTAFNAAMADKMGAYLKQYPEMDFIVVVRQDDSSESYVFAFYKECMVSKFKIDYSTVKNLMDRTSP